MKLSVVIAFLMIAGTAEAQIKPLRADGGIQTATQSGWTGPNGVPGWYYKVSSGWWIRKPDNTEIGPIGAGGASTLALLYGAGASQTDSTMTLDSTRLALRILDAGSTLGTLFTIANNAASTNYFNVTANNTQLLKSGMGDGAAAIAVSVDTVAAWANVTSKLLRLSSNAVEKWSWTPGGTMNTPGNFIASGASSATNTIGMSHVANVADGASSVAHDFNNATTLANAAASLIRVRNNGTTLLTAVVNNSDGVKLKDGGGSSTIGLSTNAGTTMCYGTACYTAGVGSNTITDGTGTLVLTGGVLTLTIPSGVPDADATRDWGTSAIRWRTVGAKQVVPGMATQAFSATPNFDCTANAKIHIGPVTGNITAATFTAGSAALSGTECTIFMEKDATAGTYTVTFAGAVRGNSATFASGARALLVWTFVWDNSINTPAWCAKTFPPTAL